ncbi:MAG TPA: hypothetical protein DD738_15400 [Ruminiclostridium sp.]|nr:hypothetical protein [Ruminiclostridium sp.]
MKKIISLVLCVAISLTIGTPAFATNDSISLSAKYSIHTEFSSIVRSANGGYAMVVDSSENILLPVGRLDIELSDVNAVNEC